MKVTFISQASVIIETEDATIWTDPWLIGTAFNDSWKLFPEPEFDDNWYSKINFLWVSHEHPDHFHFPTLKSLPKAFKENVTLLFQDNNSNKMPDAFTKLGFKNIKLLTNRKVTEITPLTKIHNCQIGQMDSSLAVMSGGKTVLNLNDCEINKNDAKLFKKDLGHIDLLLNQFSMAGYNGNYNYKEVLPKAAAHVLDAMIEDHKNLNADITVPIASYVYFCQEDNKFMNNYANSPEDIHNIFLKHNLECRFLAVNDSLDLNNINAVSKEDAYSKIKKLFANKDDKLVTLTTESVALETVENAFLDRYEQLRKVFPKIILNKLKLMRVFIPDLNKVVSLSLADGTFFVTKEDATNADFDIQINSQPLFFAFKFTWGLQTLGVSARFLIKNKFEVWKWYRIITSLNNAEIYLKPKYFFKPQNISYFMSRMQQLPSQLKYQLSRMN